MVYLGGIGSGGSGVGEDREGKVSRKGLSPGWLPLQGAVVKFSAEHTVQTYST